MKKRTALILILSLFVLNLVQGQFIKTKLDIVGGIAYPEFVHAGLRYQYNDKGQVGIYHGGDMNLKDFIVRTWSIDHMYHFGKNSYVSNRPVWYVRGGFTYSIQTQSDRTYKYSMLDFAAGRDFPVNNWLGFNLDMGFIAQVREKREFDNPSTPAWYKTDLVWIPLIRLQASISL